MAASLIDSRGIDYEKNICYCTCNTVSPHRLPSYPRCADSGAEGYGADDRTGGFRAGEVNIADSFARVENGQMLLYGCDIQPWETAGEFFQHQARRPRRLLLHKREIFKLEQQTSQKGCSLVALKLYWKNGKVRLALGLGKGKTHRDQRYDLKARVEMREAQREVARINRR